MSWITRYIKVVAALIVMAPFSLPCQATGMNWHTESYSLKTLGADVNNYYRVVGLPRNLICQFMSGQPAYNEHGHDFFYTAGHPQTFIEVEYSDDAKTIRRFRFMKKWTDSSMELEYGGWQTKDVRENASDFKTGVSIVSLSLDQDPFAMPFASMHFVPENWKKFKPNRGGCLFDIAHNYPIIGMTRAELIDILGVADDFPKTAADPTLKFDFTDKYALFEGLSGGNWVLEIAYKDNKAVAFRLSGVEGLTY